MLGKVIQLLILAVSLAFCYWLIDWVLRLVGFPAPSQLIICGLVLLGLFGLYGIVTGKADTWWGGPGP